MKKILIFAAFVMAAIGAKAFEGSGVIQKPADETAITFDVAALGLKADGKCDVTEALQAAINKVKIEQGFGVVYLPEGKYLISKTIYIPAAVRLIGYGKNRPEIILAKNTPGYQTEENYMIWFTGDIVTDGRAPSDANAGTFYSGLSNINFRIEKGNPSAIALRTHLAQHGILNHCNIYAGDAYACLLDIGNEMENVYFYGGRYGITSGPSSPSWPMAMVDVHFEGQKEAAILTRNAGMAIVNMEIKNTPVGIELQDGHCDRFYMERAYFKNVGTAVKVAVENNAHNQLNIIDSYCEKVPTLVHFKPSGRKIERTDKVYYVKNFADGLIVDNMNADSQYKTICDIEAIAQMPPFVKEIPMLPGMETWANVKDFGAVGDGETDDTEAIKKAIASSGAIFFPTGWYVISETIKLNEVTALIGMHPFATQIMLAENSPKFGGFGAPVPMIESSKGGDDILTGIGINAVANNNRAVGVKWMAGEKSYMDDVKYVGGHGTMIKPVPRDPNAPPVSFNFAFWMQPRVSTPSNPIAEQGKDLAWDTQHWSLWVTNGGGGTFKNIWTADTYASTGFYASHTSTPSKVYAMSLEHHVRFECRLNDVHNWKFYAMQFEEESREGRDCQALTVDDCSNLRFANLWFYRVIRVATPRPYAMLVSNSSNIEIRGIRNWTQIITPSELTVYDMNKNIAIYPWEFASATIVGNEKPDKAPVAPGKAERLGKGYEFAVGAVADSKGNIYFCETRMRKIYKYNPVTEAITLFADFPWKPMALSVDTQDILLVVCRSQPQPGFLVDGKPQTFYEKYEDDYSDYSGWGNSGWGTFVYAILNDGTDNFVSLNKIKTSEAKNVSRVVYPAHRLRNNFDQITQWMPKECFVAPDGVTIVPEYYDLTRSTQLMNVDLGKTKTTYITSEYTKHAAKYEVQSDGSLKMVDKSIAHGEYGHAVDLTGNLYLAEGQIFVYDVNGNELKRLNVEERPLTLALSPDGKTLYYTSSTSFYRVKIE